MSTKTEKAQKQDQHYARRLELLADSLSVSDLGAPREDTPEMLRHVAKRIRKLSALRNG